MVPKAASRVHRKSKSTAASRAEMERTAAAIMALVPVNTRFLGEPWREQIRPPGLHSVDCGGTHGCAG